MANEITVTANITVTNGQLKEQINYGTLQFDQDAVGGPTPGYLTIGTSEETEAFSELSTLGWLFMRNLDANNYIQWGFATGVYGGRLEATETALFRLEPGTTLYLKANLAACKLYIAAFED